MRFELSVALRYLIPRWRQLSASIISVISVLVISLVVWLVIVFLSVTDGIEKKWIDQLVSLNAPLKMTPTEEYYKSYYYQVDQISSESNYAHKSVSEKLLASVSDPYDPAYDHELPYNFPAPDLNDLGGLKDPVKEAWELAEKVGRPQEYDVAFGQLRLDLSSSERDSFLNQVAYVVAHDEKNENFKDLLVPTTPQERMQLVSKAESEDLPAFYQNLEISRLKTKDRNFYFTTFPDEGVVEGVGLFYGGDLQKVVLPRTKKNLSALLDEFLLDGYEAKLVSLTFEQGQLRTETAIPPFVVLDKEMELEGALVGDSSIEDPMVDVRVDIQGVPLAGRAPLFDFEVVEARLLPTPRGLLPYLSGQGDLLIPEGRATGEGILVALPFQKSGVSLGDRGHLAYYARGASTTQEQRLPVYVAGFYDPGLVPIGNKMIFVNPSVTDELRSGITVSDGMLGNGINVWLEDFADAPSAKNQLIAGLEEKGLSKYWKIESFEDFEFSRPILQQLKSDKTLFTLIAIIILIVACSNIISMLILLVNDKRREIGIMQSMGASAKSVAMIFGLCGFVTGLISSVVGTIAALFTLHNLQSLVKVLSFMQGHEAFQSAFYGNQLPSELSFGALGFVLLATLLISLLAGIIPAIKAVRVRPTEILKAE